MMILLFILSLVFCAIGVFFGKRDEGWISSLLSLFLPLGVILGVLTLLLAVVPDFFEADGEAPLQDVGETPQPE